MLRKWYTVSLFLWYNSDVNYPVVANFATTASDVKEFNNELIRQRNVQKMHIPNSQQD